MKTIFWVVFCLLMLIYSARPSISLKPFSISFEAPVIPLAIICLIVSIVFFQYQASKDSKIELLEKYYSQGLEDGYDIAIEKIKKIKKARDK